MLKRSIYPKLQKALSRSPIVLLNGARQVGKTTLTKEFIKSNRYTYITFDDEVIYLAAKKDPIGFIKNIDKPVIIDEVQRVPEIFLPIKVDVDENRIAGRYLLTGSANPLLIPRLGDSLAGRMEVIDLMPLSQGEILGKEETFIDTIFSNQQLKTPKASLSKEQLYTKIITGGYPSVQNLDEEDREAWLHSYLSLLLQKDVRDLAQIEKLAEFPKLLQILASRVSGLVNVADLSRESKMIGQTLHRYLALLETIFIIFLQLPWSSNLTLRFVKSPKLYLVDSGLAMHLLGMNLQRAIKDSVTMGKILENFIVNELKKQATWNKTRINLFHFRTSDNKEVDIILENRSGEIIGIEIKGSNKVTPDDFKGLKYLQSKVKDKFIKGIVLYTGSECVPFGENLYLLPVNALWEKID